MKRRRAAVTVLAMCFSFALSAAVPTVSWADGTTAANIARGELGSSGSYGHGEDPALSGCNKYTGALYGQTPGCAAGYGNRGAFGTWAWCADFATWVWQQAGFDISGLTSAVSSFTAYGNAHGTYHSVSSGYIPQPGDAALYGNAHVGIVVSSGKMPPDVVSGNMLVAGDWQVYLGRDSTSNGGGAALTGFVTPVGASGGGGPTIGQILGSSCQGLHTGPSGTAPQVDCVPNGATASIECVKNGQSVSGPYGTENIWDRTTYNGKIGFVSDAWVYTGSNSAVAPNCGGNGVVMTPGCQTLYATPTTTSAALACIPEAVTVTVDCTLAGDSAPGPFGSETLWDHTSYGGTGFVPDAEIYTGTSAAIAGTCASIPQPPLVVTAALPNGVTTQGYSASLTASRGNGTYTWSVQRDALPSGLTLNADGTLSGTPDTAGTVTFAVQVADGNGLVGTASESIRIIRSLEVISSSLASGVVGKAYSAGLSFTGGTPGYLAQLTAGALPVGLSMSSAGVISGTPSAPGAFGFTVKATDSSNPALSASKSFTLQVDAAGAGPLIPDPGATDAQITAALASALVPHGSAAAGRVILRKGAFAVRLHALAAGRVTITWYTTGRRGVLVAVGAHSFSAPGFATVQIRLTTAGRHRLRDHATLRLIARAAIARAGTAPVRAVRTFTVRR